MLLFTDGIWKSHEACLDRRIGLLFAEKFRPQIFLEAER
jgi:hypothetical protein